MATKQPLTATEQRNAVSTRRTTSVLALVALVEHEYNLHGRIPQPEVAAALFHTTPEEIASVMASADFQKRLERRGISSQSSNMLTAEQIAVANLMLDYSDQRSQAAKLKAAGVNSQTWQGWLANPIFNRYLRGRAEGLLEQVGVAEAHTALLKATTKGNVQAIKLLYEVTGRHRDSTSLNVEYFISRLIEIIQSHVKDPVALQAIAGDFQTLMGEIK